MSVRVSTWAWEQQLPAHLKLVLLALADHANDDGWCYPGQERLARMCGVKPRALRDSLRQLEVAGLADTTRRGNQTTNLYRVGPAVASGSGLPIASGSPARGDRQWTADGDRQWTADKPSGEPPVEPSAAASGSGLPTTLPEVRLARLWADLTGVPPTRAVLKRWVPLVRDHHQATGRWPTEADLRAAHTAGIREPSGWAFVMRTSSPWPGWVAAHLLTVCTNPDAPTDPRWEREYGFGPHSPVPETKRPVIRAKSRLLTMRRGGEHIDERTVARVLTECHDIPEATA